MDIINNDIIERCRCGDQSAFRKGHIANNLVAAGVCDRALVQVAYAIGIAKPVSLYVNTYGPATIDMHDGKIAEKIQKIFDMTPYGIIKRFNLKKPIYQPTATYGHFGRELPDAKVEGIKVSFFPWEKLDYVEKIKKAFNL